MAEDANRILGFGLRFFSGAKAVSKFIGIITVAALDAGLSGPMGLFLFIPAVSFSGSQGSFSAPSALAIFVLASLVEVLVGSIALWVGVVSGRGPFQGYLGQ